MLSATSPVGLSQVPTGTHRHLQVPTKVGSHLKARSPTRSPWCSAIGSVLSTCRHTRAQYRISHQYASSVPHMLSMP
eukprot:881864-Rhodomonas_salina.1